MALAGGQAPPSRAMAMMGKVATTRMTAMTAVAAPPAENRVTAVKAEVGGEAAAGETAATPQAAVPQAVDLQGVAPQAAAPLEAVPQVEIPVAVVEAVAGEAEGVIDRARRLACAGKTRGVKCGPKRR